MPEGFWLRRAGRDNCLCCRTFFAAFAAFLDVTQSMDALCFAFFFVRDKLGVSVDVEGGACVF